jgi:hypothetical protein
MQPVQPDHVTGMVVGSNHGGQCMVIAGHARPIIVGMDNVSGAVAPCKYKDCERKPYRAMHGASGSHKSDHCVNVPCS